MICNFFAMIIACLNFISDSEKIYFVGTNKKINFYELWQLHKQLKIIEMSEAGPDTYDEGYIHQFQPEPTHNIH